MMKIAHVIECLDIGGAERVLLDLIVHRPDPNVKHQIICLSYEGSLADEFKKNDISIQSLNKRPGFDSKILKSLNRVLSEENPDIVHTHLFTGSLWGRLIAWYAHFPCVMNVQNYDSWTGWRGLAERFLVNIPQVTICVSQSAFEQRRKYGLKIEKTQIISNGSSRKVAFDTKKIMCQQWNIPEDSFVVGAVARCEPQKNPQLFVDIAYQVLEKKPNICFVWIGEGSLKDLLMANIKSEFREKIKFLGPTIDPMPCFAAFDMVLSTSNYEGFSLSLLEAMRSGKPILATAVPGNKELLEDLQPDLLLGSSVVEGMAEKILNAFENPTLSTELGKKLKAQVEKFHSAQKMAAAYNQIYREVLSI